MHLFSRELESKQSFASLESFEDFGVRSFDIISNFENRNMRDFGLPQSYIMKSLRITTSPLIRQVSEAVYIQRQAEQGTSLNRKGEWGQNLAPKRIVEGDAKYPPGVAKCPPIGKT